MTRYLTLAELPVGTEYQLPADRWCECRYKFLGTVPSAPGLARIQIVWDCGSMSCAELNRKGSRRNRVGRIFKYPADQIPTRHTTLTFALDRTETE